MGFPTFENFRELLPPKVRLNADDLAAQMQGFLGKEHHASGTHGDITADSIDTGPITIVSEDWWIAFERENTAGNRTLIGRLTQADAAIILQVAGTDAMAFGVQSASGPGREQQVHDGLTVLDRIKLFGQGSVSADPPGILQDDAALGLRYSVYAVTATAARLVSGFATTNPTEGGRGQLLILWNASTFAITFAHDATATSFMRLICPGGVNLVMPPLTASIWIYDVDPAVLRWRCIGGTIQSSGGGAGGMNLDYLGGFVSGPVYNDGDIVVADDGIAYMCVVDGTVTPPEPWPGVGIATAVGPPGPPGPKGDKGDPGTNAAIDATYWTVSGHPALTNERAMDGLGNGYVKSTAGEPSVVATIPFGDTTGIVPDARLSPNVALKNADNIFSGSNTVTGAMNYQSATPNILFTETDQAAPYKRLIIDGGFWQFQTLANDAATVTATLFAIGPTGIFVGAGGTITANGSLLTNLNATAITTGIVNPARLGTGTADATTVLYGDSVYRPVSGIPSGLIVLSDTPCPPGWTRVNWDGAFLRVNATAGGTGGSNTHQHGAGTLATASHTHGGATGPVSVSVSGTTGAVGDHAHGFSAHVAGTTASASGLNAFAGSGAIQLPVPQHTHDFAADISGTSGIAGGHSHSFSGSGSGTGSIAADAPGVTGTTALASNVPLYIDVILCRKN